MHTIYQKIRAAHLVARLEGGAELLYVDRHLLHEVTSPQAFAELARRGLKVRRPDLTFATTDHVLPTTPYTRPLPEPEAEEMVSTLEENTATHGIRLFGPGHQWQGVVHVTMAELGVILPGQVVVCGDSHTATHGALGAVAFGIGTSEVAHVLATQCVIQRPLKDLAVVVTGSLRPGVSAKDLALAIIATLGTKGGQGRAIEYMGPGVEALEMPGRFTLCNMSVECGARVGLVAPDEKTFAWLEGKPFAPRGKDFDWAVKTWEGLKSDPEAFDERLGIEAQEVDPMVTWGTTPAQACSVLGQVPDPAELPPEQQAEAMRALEYMGLEPGTHIQDIPIDYAFIGSCTNGRLEDLRAAAMILKGKKVSPRVEMIVVPGSAQVKAQAEAEGLDKIFTAAGAQWRLPGCSMCLAMNPDHVPPGRRCISTSNRNFEDRQGPGARTHLASPATVAASAITGYITNPLTL